MSSEHLDKAREALEAAKGYAPADDEPSGRVYVRLLDIAVVQSRIAMAIADERQANALEEISQSLRIMARQDLKARGFAQNENAIR